MRGHHGAPLAFLAAAWVFERLGMACQADWPAALFLLSNNLFLCSIALMLAFTLWRHRRTDSYRDNGFFLVMLPAFLVAKQCLLSESHFQAGWVMTLGLFRLAFLVMLERTLTQFMKNVFQLQILRLPLLDGAIKGLALALVAAGFMPPLLAAGLSGLLALLLSGRLAFWHPLAAGKRIDLGIMYLGYLALTLQLVVDSCGAIWPLPWTGALSVHLFSFGVMGLIIPAMLIRISKGHTGRKPGFDAIDRGVLKIMILGLILRVAMPQLWPQAYPGWLALAATCWFACFSILAWRYLPFLLQARVDGREH